MRRFGDAIKPWGRAWPQWILLVLALVIWGYSVTFDFVWDDQQFVVENSSIRSLKNLPAMFTELSAQSSYPEGFKLFRPLRTVHYALLFYLGGGEKPVPWLFHLANVLWHAMAGLLCYRATVLLFARLAGSHENRDLAAFLVAAGFIAHPVVAEVVCWVKSLDDIMAASFTFAALILLLRERGSGRSCAASLAFFILAVYSKISALPFAAIVGPLLLLLGHSWKRSFVRSVPFFCAAGIFMVHRHWVIGQSSQHAPISGTYFQTLVDMFPVIPVYVRLLWGMPPFCADYTYLQGGYAVLSTAVVGGGLLLLVGLALCVYAWMIPRWRLAGWGGLWLLLFMIPVANLLPMMQYMAERFLYLPLAGWLWLLASAGLGLLKRRASWIWAGLLVLAWAGLAWQRSFVWKDSLTLFVTSSRDFPGAKRIQKNAVAAVFALPHIREFFPLTGPDQQAAFSGPIPADKRRAILETLREAQRLYPQNSQVANALGILFADSGQPKLAVEEFRKAAEASPSSLHYWENLIQACRDAGETNLAHSYQETASRMAGFRPALTNANPPAPR